MKNIASYLAQKKKRAQRTTSIDDQTIMHLFSRAIKEEYGKQGEHNIVPQFYKNGVIFVKIDNSIWAQELWLRRSFFTQKLNAKIGHEVIKNIKVAT